MRDTVYVVAAAPGESSKISGALSSAPFDVRTAGSAEELIAALGAGACGCVVAPVDLPGIGVRGLIDEIRRRQLRLAVVVIGREDDLRVAVDIVRAGAAEFVEHPFSAAGLRSAVRRALVAARVARSHSR